VSNVLPTARDREVSEACRNSASRAERDAIVARYRGELIDESCARLEALHRRHEEDLTWKQRTEVAEARVVDLESALREMEAGVIVTQASVEQGRFEVRRLLAASDRLLKIGECTSDNEIRELAVDEFNRAEAAETRVRDLDAVALRLSTYIETLESANADLAGCLERAEAAEARVHELEFRLGEFLPAEMLEALR
jgi:hypothetical protein